MKTLRSTLAILALGLASLSAFAAAPSPEAVQEAIRAQNWTQAEAMLTEVTREKPNSAKAWYYLAQTEEKLGHTSAAKADLARAEKLQPDLKFASPGAVQSLEARLNGSHVATIATHPTYSRPTQVATHADSGMALFWVLGIMLVCGIAIWAIYRALFRPVAYINGGAPVYGGAGGGYVGGGGPVYGGGGSTVVVNGGHNSSGLVEGMVLGSLLSDHHHHDSYRDDSYRDRGYSAPAPASSWDNTPAPSSDSSSFDLGGGSSSSWDSGSSSSSSFDGGGSSSGDSW